MSCNKKARRFASDNYEDRISNLDENVLSHILSLLPTKEVFRTSVLSKQWRYKWTYAYTMEVNDGKYPLFCNKETFVQLVTQLLFFSQRLKNFSICMCNPYDSSRVQRWISIVLRHNLESLQVWCFKGREIVFPESLLNSTCLRTLYLRQKPKCIMNVAIRNCAPNLTSLCLEGVEIVNGDSSTTTVKFSFPLLENLKLILCTWLNVKLVEIDAPSLTTFDSTPGGADDQGLKEYGYSIQISAPRLANFKCRWTLPENYAFCKGTGGGSIISAVFNTDMDIEDYTSPEDKSLFATKGLRVGNYINSFTNLQELELSDFMSRILPLTCMRLDKLRRLKLLYAPHAEKLFQILHKTPSLKFLSIDLFCWEDDCDYEGSLLPTCILYHLEEVELIDFYIDIPDLFHLPNFFLKNAEQLKKLCFIVPGDPQETKEFLSSYYRSSPNLAIEVVRK